MPYFEEKYLKGKCFIENMVSKEFEWFREHYPELIEKYPGKTVAIFNSKVLGVGNTISEAEREARKFTTAELFFGKVRKKRAMIL